MRIPSDFKPVKQILTVGKADSVMNLENVQSSVETQKIVTTNIQIQPPVMSALLAEDV